jgi:hypothetical protein
VQESGEVENLSHTKPYCSSKASPSRLRRTNGHQGTLRE